MITTNPVPTGQCRICKHCHRVPYTELPPSWLQECKAVEDIEPEDTLAGDLASQLEASLFRLAHHYDCPDFVRNE